ncbi:MAG: ferredoxin [Sphingobacteriales bacterium]|nr:ferredoxin [Sphingobacteriales bacterium]
MNTKTLRPLRKLCVLCDTNMEEDLLKFRIVAIKQETAKAKTYELDPVDESIIDFQPGQFLTFIIHTEKQDVRRSYSIVSLPGEALKITVKKVDNGLISRYILRNWQIGTIVNSLPPAGRFIIRPQQEIERDIFCFAAGSGIAPILPQIRKLLLEENQSIIHLIYSNTNETEALFMDEIRKLENHFPKLEVIHMFSEPIFRLKERGRLSNLFAQELVHKHLRYLKEDAVFLICGPFTYMRMLSITLISMHFLKENILKENFIPEIMRSGNIFHPNFPDRNVEINIKDKHFSILVKSGQDILSATLENGLKLPYSCRGGVCGSCAAICKSGKVTMSINEVLTDKDIDEGWVLICTGYPEEENTQISFNP